MRQKILDSLSEMVLSISMIAAPFYGWWQLGRQVSMSPIELANAFDSSLMRDEGIANLDLDTLLQVVGTRQVKYGVVQIMRREIVLRRNWDLSVEHHHYYALAILMLFRNPLKVILSDDENLGF